MLHSTATKLAQIRVVHGAKVLGIRLLIVGTQSHKRITEAYSVSFYQHAVMSRFQIRYGSEL